MTAYRTTLVTEAYNLTEGQSEAAYRSALASLMDIGGRKGDVELIVVDPSSEGLGRQGAAEVGGDIRYLALPGLTYDQQKTRAAETASADVVVYLDGDCRPDHADWLDQLLLPFSDPKVEAVGGLTLYDDLSTTGKAMSILDFGYLFLSPRAIMGCYASNNVAFRRSTWLSCPPPDGELRSNCFAHAQLMIRERRPLVMQPAALVWHELPDIHAERYRRGYDLVGACWVNPFLQETFWLGEGVAAWEKFMDLNTGFLEERLLNAPASLGISVADLSIVREEMLRLRQIDAEGVRDALVEGEREGKNAQALARRTSLRFA